MTENWKPVYGYEDLYEVSDCGRVKSLISNIIMKPYLNDTGYYVVSLSKNGISKRRKIHRLMMLSFIGPDPIRKVVNHKDGNKLNNTLANLEWVTSAENNRHARDTGLIDFDYERKEFHITIDDLDFTVKGARVAAERLHDEEYFTDVSVYNLKAAITNCANKHYLYLGVLKAEKIDDPFDEVPKYNRCGIKGRLIRAQLPNGNIAQAKGPSKLVDGLQSLGYWMERDRESMIKLVSEAALHKYQSCYGIKV